MHIKLIKFFIYSFLVQTGLQLFADVENKEIQIKNFDGMMHEEYSMHYEPYFVEVKEAKSQLHNSRVIEKVAPKYPNRAASRLVMGTSLVGYRVMPDGTVSDIEVIDEFPKGLGFARAGIKAAEKFQYAPLDSATELLSETVYRTNRFNFSLEPSKISKREYKKLTSKVHAGNFESMYEFAVAAPKIYKIKLSREQVNQWVLKSALGGYPLAQINLALRLFNGVGVQKDRQKAEKWLMIAASNGNDFAKNFLEKYATAF